MQLQHINLIEHPDNNVIDTLLLIVMSLTRNDRLLLPKAKYEINNHILWDHMVWVSLY